jgi:hypothetical protein
MLALGAASACGSPPKAEDPKPEPVAPVIVKAEAPERAAVGEPVEGYAEQSCDAAMDGWSGENPRENGPSAGEVGRILNGGSYLAGCNVPPTADVKICVAMVGGKAVGVTTTLTPGAVADAECVSKAVAELTYPKAPGMSVSRTHFAPTE